MELNKYQKQALKTAFYPSIGNNLAYPALGLTGEAGEVADKIKKIIRDKGGIVNDLDRVEIAKEVGDCLWYIAIMAKELGFSLQEIAEINLEKLIDRKNRNVLIGSGDNR